MRVDVGRIARQRHPAERALALAEQRPDVGRHEPGIAERVRVAVLGRQPAQRVAVVERLGAGRAAARGSRRRARSALSPTRRRYSSGSRCAQRVGLLERQPGRDVAVQRVVRGGLVGDDVDSTPRRTSSGRTSAALPARPIDSGAALARGRRRSRAQRVVEIGRALVQVAGLDAALDPLRGRPRRTARSPPSIVIASGWAPPMPPRPAVTHEAAGERAVEALARGGRERLVRALEDPLASRCRSTSRRSSGRT